MYKAQQSGKAMAGFDLAGTWQQSSCMSDLQTLFAG
jgi:hypothetical protein